MKKTVLTILALVLVGSTANAISVGQKCRFSYEGLYQEVTLTRINERRTQTFYTFRVKDQGGNQSHTQRCTRRVKIHKRPWQANCSDFRDKMFCE